MPLIYGKIILVCAKEYVLKQGWRRKKPLAGSFDSPTEPAAGGVYRKGGDFHADFRKETRDYLEIPFT